MSAPSDFLRGVERYIEEYRAGKPSRQWIAAGLVMLDHMSRHCPLASDLYLTRAGGEIANTRSGLGDVLERFGVPRTFLKEVTSRSNLSFGERFVSCTDGGRMLSGLSEEVRGDQILRAAAMLRIEAEKWLARKHIQVALKADHAPGAWVGSVLQMSEGKSGGRVEQHLVGAKLEERHPGRDIQLLPGHAGDQQTGRSGDYMIGKAVYHITASPSGAVLRKCAENHERGLRPVLVVPRPRLPAIRAVAEDMGLAQFVSMQAIEDFIECNVLEISGDRDIEPHEVFRAIIERYNLRIEAVESDPSLRIEVL
ncbi:MAG TPA: hypothetical protein DEB06_10095 [Phycisphaerales bacterium]|nr:hypothetical protein [Phycisphaerales bacterium]